MGPKWAQMGLYQMGSLNYLLNQLVGLIFIYLGPYFNYFKGLTNYFANFLGPIIYLYGSPIVPRGPYRPYGP